MHPLDGVWLKLDRAKEHLDFLYTAIGEFWQLKPITVVPQDDPQSSDYQFRIEIHREPDIKWSILAGEVTFHLRSALDHLAWQLALLHVKGREPSLRTEFPIFDTSTAYDDPRVGAAPKLKDILPAAHPDIESLQPYHRAEWPLVDLLWMLHRLNITDKHRILIASFPQSMVRFDDAPGIFRNEGRLNDGDVIYVPKPIGNVKMEIGTDISFEYADLPFGVNFDRLDGMHKFIREEVMPRFVGFFP